MHSHMKIDIYCLETFVYVNYLSAGTESTQNVACGDLHLLNSVMIKTYLTNQKKSKFG